MIIVKLCCLPKSMVNSVDNLMIGTIVFLVPVFWISQFWFRTKGPKLQSKHSRETKCNWPLIAHCAVGLEIVVFPFCPILLWVCAIRIVRKLCFLIDAWDVKGLCLCVYELLGLSGTRDPSKTSSIQSLSVMTIYYQRTTGPRRPCSFIPVWITIFSLKY